MRYRRSLRRVMHNRSDQQVGQVAQRSPELVVEPLPASVGRHLGRQAGQKTAQRLGPVALQGEEVLELVYDPFDDLALARSPAPICFRPRPLGVVFGSGRYQRSIEIQPASFPLNARKALVGQVGFVRVLDDEKVPYGALVGGRLRKPKGADHALWADRKRHLEAVNPLGLGGAPAEGGLPSKQPFARSSYPHDGRDESGVQDMVELRNSTELSGHRALEVAQIGLHGAHPPVESALGGSEECSSFHQSSTNTYNETKKESRSSMAPSFGESLVHQHTILAPSPFFAIMHQTSKVSASSSTLCSGPHQP